MPENVDQHVGVHGSAYLSTPDQIRQVVAALGFPVTQLQAMSDDMLVNTMSNWISGGLANRMPAVMQPEGTPPPVDQNRVTTHELPESFSANDAVTALLEQLKRQQADINQLKQARDTDQINGLFENEILHKPNLMRDELRAKWQENQLNSQLRCRDGATMKEWILREERWLKRLAKAAEEASPSLVNRGPGGPNIFAEAVGAEFAPGPMKLSESLASAASDIGLDDYEAFQASQPKN